ncbi:Lcl domain-containing protein [Candidatus Venteria ishoeyi]|uniref:Lcl C-terminal domain-containing protein n=1 Tax=Candidatus Venteria ishoeyi TaxID=1899563 RepID=A0A1H6F3P1_9GAMM|nr:DUF1566 domain-containing protein [Candidatus Venteria ishoeyi]SEH04767.1 Uncharacterised protein [Candidatus Venteria ishoeyi]
MKRFLILLLGLFTYTAHADEGALALKTEPRDAKIYINGTLKANTTPIILKLAPGSYQIKAEAGNKQAKLEVLIPDGGMVHKTLYLTSSGVALTEIQNLIDYYQPKRDAFETQTEFAARQAKLRQQLNAAIADLDPRFRAGTARLDKSAYDINNGRFPLTIEWSAWAKGLSLESKGSIQANRDQARALWGEGQEKAVFIKADGALLVVLRGLEQHWAFEGDEARQVKVRQEKIKAKLETERKAKLEAERWAKLTPKQKEAEKEAKKQAKNRYTAYPDGTALDKVTGLIWMRCSLGQTWNGSTCQGEATTFDWERAKKQQISFAGFSNWRLPTIAELRTLRYCSSGYCNTDSSYNKRNVFGGKNEELHFCIEDYESPTIVATVFPNTPTYVFWSVSLRASDSDYVLDVHFRNGVDGFSYYGNNENYVRLVRDR